MESNSDKNESYYARNRRKRLAYQKEYYWTNKQRILKEKKEREKNDPEIVAKKKKYQTDYYKTNKAKILAKRAETKAKRSSRQNERK